MRIRRLNPDILFQSEHLSRGLAQKTARGGVTTLTAQGLQFLIQTGSTMILARLLSPTDYGIIEMAAVVINFLAMFKDAGLSIATIQQEHITHEQISTLFWFNVLISVGLGLVILASAPLVGLFFKRSELVLVTAALSINFILGGLTIQHNALLQRHMMFQAQRTILIGSLIAGVIVSIILAYFGWRYWSLVWGTLTTNVVQIAQTWFYCRWLPGRIKRGTGVRKMAKFGVDITAFNFINYFARNGDNLLIGKFIGAEALGLYSKAYAVVYLPVVNIRSPLNSVAFPALSRMQHDCDRFRRYLREINFALAFLSMPLMAFCVMFPREIILLIFGRQWLGMTTVFRLLAIAGFSQTVIGSLGMMVLACGQSKLYLKLGIIGTLFALTGFGIGIHWGITGVAASFIAVSYLPQYFLFRMAFRSTPGRFTDFLEPCFFPFIFSWLAVLAPYFFIRTRSLSGHIVLLGAALTMSAIYTGLFLAVPSSRQQLLKVVAVLTANSKVNEKLLATVQEEAGITAK